MSNYLAIAGVSRSLRSLLLNRMDPLNGTTVEVTIAPPDVTISGKTGMRLNLYLYQVSENGFLKNQEIPGQGHPGMFGHPPLSLNLFYLLTAYGANETLEDADVTAQQILGSAMRVLNDFSIITPNMHEDDDPARPLILDARLMGAFEQIKVTLLPTTLEDLSKIWTALPKANFRRSVTYQVSAIQIENQRPRRFPRPVGEPPPAGPKVYVIPFRRPSIDEIRVRRQGDPSGTERPLPYARVDDTLVLRGSSFASAATRVVLGTLEFPVTPHSEDRIEFVIPDSTFPSGEPIPAVRCLQPGPQTVEVRTGVAALPRAGFESNPAVMMLVPRVQSRSLNLSSVPRVLTISGKRLCFDPLTGETLIGHAVIPKNAYTSASSNQISVPLPDTLPAWPVQCLVSGDLSVFPSLTGPFDMNVTIGTDGPHIATLADKPATLAQAALFIQSAIRHAAGGAAFKGARVAVTTMGKQLVIVPGGLGATTTITVSGGIAEPLKLSGGHGEALDPVYLSGELMPFPVLTSGHPEVHLQMGGVSRTVPLPSRPLTLIELAPMLEVAIRGAGPEPAFSNAQVTALGNQLLIVPGAAGNVVFDKVAGSDETTVSELQLQARYRVRVRVNGAESVDDVDVEMPA